MTKMKQRKNCILPHSYYFFKLWCTVCLLLYAIFLPLQYDLVVPPSLEYFQQERLPKAPLWQSPTTLKANERLSNVASSDRNCKCVYMVLLLPQQCMQPLCILYTHNYFCCTCNHCSPYVGGDPTTQFHCHIHYGNQLVSRWAIMAEISTKSNGIAWCVSSYMPLHKNGGKNFSKAACHVHNIALHCI